jgi:metal-responsive CopG/Arc/MetJ family transcriptional regulator
MQTISLKLPDQLLAELNKTAKARRVTKSQLVRESLQQTLHPKRKGELSVFDLIGDLAGSIKGLPEDLATNPKYMEGFGE